MAAEKPVPPCCESSLLPVCRPSGPRQAPRTAGAFGMILVGKGSTFSQNFGTALVRHAKILVGSVFGDHDSARSIQNTTHNRNQFDTQQRIDRFGTDHKTAQVTRLLSICTQNSPGAHLAIDLLFSRDRAELNAHHGAISLSGRQDGIQDVQGASWCCCHCRDDGQDGKSTGGRAKMEFVRSKGSLIIRLGGRPAPPFPSSCCGPPS